MTTTPGKRTRVKPVKVLLFGAEAQHLEREFEPYPNLTLVETDPDVVVCFGGDGTLLAAELQWPGLPKVPILNSQRGHRCIPHRPAQVIADLAEGMLVRNQYSKLVCAIHRRETAEPERIVTPLNEINVHKERINSAVRYKLWIDGEAYEDGLEILGDGFIICTPFGSTAYFSKVTRGTFKWGIGIAFKASNQQINHLVLPPDGIVRVLITRGPAQLAVDSADEYIRLVEDDELVVRKLPKGATILTCGPVRRLDEPF